MSRAAAYSREPEFRLAASIPTNWCLDCQLTLRTDDEYLAHTRVFPAHHVKAVGSLVCPRCGKDVELDNGRFTEHMTGYPERICSSSGADV
jgi:hypothetical protein